MRHGRQQITGAARMAATALINIDVDDLERGVRFYAGCFGLQVGRKLGPAIVELLGAASPIYLLEKASGSLASQAADDRRRYGRHWTPVHLDFVVADLDATVKAAIAAGATLEAPAATHVWGRIAHLADPFGHGVCLVEFLGRGYDEIATG
jgi:predicted enzyme related to lactoylglutathione lyase